MLRCGSRMIRIDDFTELGMAKTGSTSRTLDLFPSTDRQNRGTPSFGSEIGVAYLHSPRQARHVLLLIAH